MNKVSLWTNIKVGWQLQKLFRNKYDKFVVYLQRPQFDLELNAIRGDALYILAKMYELYNSDLKSYRVLQECIDVAMSTQAGRYYFLDDLEAIRVNNKIQWETVGN